MQCARPQVCRSLLGCRRAEGRPRPVRGLCHRPAADGPVYGIQYEDIRYLPEIHCPGGHPCLFHRRGVPGRDRLSGHLPAHPQGAGEDDDAGRAADHGHRGCGGHRYESVSVQSGHGHRGQACGAGRGRRAHRPAGRRGIPQAHVGPPAADGFLAGGQRVRQEAGGERPVHHGRHSQVLPGRPGGVSQ